MAFCTNCGATVQGAFCQQCGTPVSASASQPPRPQAAPQAAPVYAAPPPQAAPVYAAPQAVPVKTGMSPIVIVLLVVVGVIVLGVVGLVGTGLYFAHAVAKNPGLVMAKIITAANPDAEVLSTDTGTQTMRVRNKKTGEEVTISFDDLKQGKFKFSAKGSNGEVANVEIGGGEGKMPSWVPVYPGAKAMGNMTAKGDSGDGTGEGGVVTFTTPDAPAKVMSFYQGKCKDVGATVALAESSDAGGMFTCTDEGDKRSLSVLVGGSGGETSFTLTYGRKK